MTKETIRTLTSHKNAQTTELNSFDPRGEYDSIINSVKSAGNGEVALFEVPMKGARREYWVLSVDEKGKRVVGVRVGSVES